MRHSTLFITLILVLNPVASACTGPPSQRQASLAGISPTPAPFTPGLEPSPTPPALPSSESTPEAVTEAQQSDQNTPNTPVVTAGASNVNIRSGPGTDYDVVGTLPAGQSLEIVGRTADSSWWQVALPGGVGWVAASVTTASNVDDNILIAEAPALSTTLIEAPIEEVPVISGLQEAQVIECVSKKLKRGKIRAA